MDIVVMAGLVPAIHAFAWSNADVDGRPSPAVTAKGVSISSEHALGAGAPLSRYGHRRGPSHAIAKV
jgi:hypothetical protein